MRNVRRAEPIQIGSLWGCPARRPVGTSRRQSQAAGAARPARLLPNLRHHGSGQVLATRCLSLRRWRWAIMAMERFPPERRHSRAPLLLRPSSGPGHADPRKGQMPVPGPLGRQASLKCERPPVRSQLPRERRGSRPTESGFARAAGAKGRGREIMRTCECAKRGGTGSGGCP